MSKVSAKFTFKKEPVQTGLAGVGYSRPSTTIKLNKREVGTIAAPCWSSTNDLWRIRLAKRDEKASGGFRWVTLKATFETEPAAREFLRNNAEKIQSIGLYEFEDE